MGYGPVIPDKKKHPGYHPVPVGGYAKKKKKGFMHFFDISDLAKIPKVKYGKGKNPSIKGSPAPGGSGGYSTVSGGYSGGSGGGGGAGGGGGGMNYYGLGKPPGYNRKEAQNIVQHEINSQIRDLLSQARKQKGNRDFDISKVMAAFDRQKGDLNYLFNEAQDYMGAQNKKISDRFGQAGGSINELYDQFAQENGSAVAARKSAAMNELQRLGIQQAGLGQFDADAANAAATAGVNQQNTNANLQAMQTASSSVGDLLGSMAEGSRSSSIGRALNQRDQSAADIRQQFAQYMTGVQDQVRDVKKDKFSMVNDLMRELQAQRFAQFMELGQSNFNNQLASNNFNLNTSQFNAGNFWKKAGLQQEASQAAAAAKYQNALLQQQNLQGAMSKLFNF